MAVPSFVQQWWNLLHPFTFPCLFVVGLLFLFWLNKPHSPKLNIPPSPPKLPILGNLHQLGHEIHRSCKELAAKYGPMMILRLGSVRTLVVSSAEMVNEILTTHDIAFSSRPAITAGDIMMYGNKDVAFAPYGAYWRFVRKITVIDLLSTKRVQSYKSIRDEEVAQMVEKISVSCSMRAPVNLTEMVLTLSSNTIFRAALGIKPVGQEKFLALQREVFRLSGAFSFGDLFPWLGWMDTFSGAIRRMKKVTKEIDMFLEQVIDEHLAKRKQEDGSSIKNFIGILVGVLEDNIDGNHNFNRDNIKAIILDMFLAGTDSIATSIEWAIAELVKNPEVMKKAQEEVRRVVGTKSKIDDEDIAQMDYLQCVIKETLRLHIPLPFLVPKETTKDTNVKGYHIPSKTRVFINAWAIQRDPSTWERAEEFIPERFISDPLDFNGQNAKFMPFGAGRRICPGMLFALVVVEAVIANLLYRFDWDVPGGANKEELDMSEGTGNLNVNKKLPLLLLPSSHFSYLCL